VFCDPGKATGIHLSWSMTIAAGDPARVDALARFTEVVEKSLYMRYEDATGKARR